MNRTVLAGILTSGALSLAACEATPEPTEEQTQPSATAVDESPSRAVAQLEAKSGSDLRGEAFFVAEGANQVSFGIYVEGVSPGEHAVHLHETGDCSAEDASSAGAHWNPTNEDHGQWGVPPFHLGDIGNIVVGEDGDGSLSLTTDSWSLSDEGERAVVGRAVVVHEGADDFTTQPGGAAGARIGCGVIQWKPQT